MVPTKRKLKINFRKQLNTTLIGWTVFTFPTKCSWNLRNVANWIVVWYMILGRACRHGTRVQSWNDRRCKTQLYSKNWVNVNSPHSEELTRVQMFDLKMEHTNLKNQTLIRYVLTNESGENFRLAACTSTQCRIHAFNDPRPRENMLNFNCEWSESTTPQKLSPYQAHTTRRNPFALGLLQYSHAPHQRYDSNQLNIRSKFSYATLSHLHVVYAFCFIDIKMVISFVVGCIDEHMMSGEGILNLMSPLELITRHIGLLKGMHHICVFIPIQLARQDFKKLQKLPTVDGLIE